MKARIRSLLNRLRGQRAPDLTPEQAIRLAELCGHKASVSRRSIQQRMVVVDVESSGLNCQKDRLISIGAVAVSQGVIDPMDSFEVVLRQEFASDSANILVHGIGAEAQRTGVPAEDALLAFLSFVDGAPLVAYHAFFDQAMIDRAVQRFLGDAPEAVWLDLAWLLPDLVDRSVRKAEALDFWLERFAIVNPKRHNAVCDSWVTAQLLQVALQRSVVAGAETVADLQAIEKARRRLMQGLSHA